MICKISRTWLFHRTTKEYKIIYNARAQPQQLFSSLSIVFSDVLAAVSVSVCLRTLVSLEGGLVLSTRYSLRRGGVTLRGVLFAFLYRQDIN